MKGKRGPRPGAKTAKVKKSKSLDAAQDFKEPVRKPRQQRLPGTEDAKIDILEDLAQDYAEIRDQRQGLSRREVELKGKLLDLMKAQKKSHYQRDGVEITVIVEKEKVKVRIKGHGESEDTELPEE
jgi:hypothetical protein